MTGTVAFVTKPIEAPWTDGTKNLVRDLAVGLSRPTLVYSTRGETLSLGRPTLVPKGPARVPFAVRVIGELSGSPPDILHFFFAPNARSCGIARAWIRALRARGFRGATIQTVASTPKEWKRSLFFADHVVVQSEWAKQQLAEVRSSGVSVIRPATPIPVVTEERLAIARESVGASGARIITYPGDLEFSKGAWTAARAFVRLAKRIPEARVVFACRRKTPRALVVEADIAAYLRAEGLEDRAAFVGEVKDLPALLAISSVVVFPVEDLFGKVDHPLVLLEAEALGVPLVLSDYGPLLELAADAHVDSRNLDAFVAATVQIIESGAAIESTRSKKQGVGIGTTPFVEAYEQVYEQALRGRH